MYVVIAGAGKVGWNLARELMAKDHEVTVIESERSRQFLPEDKSIPPREIARACQYLHEQDARAWTHELLLRPAAGDWSAPY